MKEEIDYEKVPGTWAHELRKHFDAFSDGCWRAFNHACGAMKDKGGMLTTDKYKWREYVLWDMQKKHDEEVKNGMDKR